MRRWVDFFFGTPRRFLGSVVGICLLAVVINPSLLERAVDRLVGIFLDVVQQLLVGLSPLLGPALTLIIVFAGIRMILGGGRRR